MGASYVYNIKMGKKMLIILGTIAIIALGTAYFLFFDKNDQTPINDLIIVDSPKPDEIIKTPFTISGKARGNWFFEASFPIELVKENREKIVTAIAQAQSEWMTSDFVPFKATIEFPVNLTGKGQLILKKDNPSGLPEYDNQIEIPVIFGGSIETMKVKVFFNNSRLDPEFSCNKVFVVEREVAKTEAVGYVALEELLKGPTVKEKSENFSTNINEGVKIQKLVIENGIAKVDFDEQLEFQVGGSCRVTAIRAQIAETLKQFPSVKYVLISINSRTEDILQP